MRVDFIFLWEVYLSKKAFRVKNYNKIIITNRSAGKYDVIV